MEQKKQEFYASVEGYRYLQRKLERYHKSPYYRLEHFDSVDVDAVKVYTTQEFTDRMAELDEAIAKIDEKHYEARTIYIEPTQDDQLRGVCRIPPHPLVLERRHLQQSVDVYQSLIDRARRVAKDIESNAWFRQRVAREIQHTNKHMSIEATINRFITGMSVTM